MQALRRILCDFKHENESYTYKWLPWDSVSKESASNAGDWGLIMDWEEPMEKGMATHSSIFAWRII